MEHNNRFYNNSFKIGITQGDYNGSSYELVINSLIDETIYDLFTPVFFGTSKLVSYFRKALKVENFSFTPVKNNEIIDNKPNLVNIFSKEAKINLGTLTSESAELATLSLQAAHEAIKAHTIDAIVCSPVQSGLFQLNNSDFNGNCSFFTKNFPLERLMRIYCVDNIRIASVIQDIQTEGTNSESSIDLLNSKIIHLDKILKRDFCITSPRIAIMAHNSINESGKYIGGEEEALIEEAVNTVLADKVYAFGPYAPSTLFGNAEYRKFDAILTISEQQAITVFTLLNGREGAIYNAGLPFTIIEPYCDASYSKFHVGNVNPQPMRYAMYLAKDITRNRIESYGLRKNTLKFSKAALAKNEPG